MAMLRARGGSGVTTLPLRRTAPAVGFSRPAITRIKVVLPQPDGPTMVRNSPSRVARSIPLRALKSPKCLATPLTSSMATALVLALPRAGGFASDVAKPLPFLGYLLHLRCGVLDRLLRRLFAASRLRHHRRQQEGVVDLASGRIGVAGITKPSGPREGAPEH